MICKQIINRGQAKREQIFSPIMIRKHIFMAMFQRHLSSELLTLLPECLGANVPDAMKEADLIAKVDRDSHGARVHWAHRNGPPANEPDPGTRCVAFMERQLKAVGRVEVLP